MTPLAQLVEALLESTVPVIEILDDMDVAREPPDPGDVRMLLGGILTPLQALFAERDLLVATAVLEAVTPLIVETSVLLDPHAAQAA